MSNHGNENLVGNELQPHCQLEKSYESLLENGTTIHVHITMSVSGATSESTEKILSEFAKCSRSFYLDAGKNLNSHAGIVNDSDIDKIARAIAGASHKPITGGEKLAVYMEADDNQKTEKKMATQEKAGG